MILVKMFLSGKVPSLILVGLSLVLTSWIGTLARSARRCTVTKAPRICSGLPDIRRERLPADLQAHPAERFGNHRDRNDSDYPERNLLRIVGRILLGLGFDSSTLSIGNLLDAGRASGIVQHPYLTIFPSVIISILMISFNPFGNGLRDALNPSLRGAEE